MTSHHYFPRKIVSSLVGGLSNIRKKAMLMLSAFQRSSNIVLHLHCVALRKACSLSACLAEKHSHWHTFSQYRVGIKVLAIIDPKWHWNLSLGFVLVRSFDSGFCQKQFKNVAFTQKVSVRWGLHVGQSLSSQPTPIWQKGFWPVGGSNPRPSRY